MSDTGNPALPSEFAVAVTRLGAATLGMLQAFEVLQRRLHPPAIQGLRSALEPLRQRLDAALAEARGMPAPQAIASFHAQLLEAAGRAAAAGRLFTEEGDPERATARVLQSLSEACRAQEALYPLRVVLPPVARFFAEPELAEHATSLDPAPPEGTAVGLQVARGSAGGRGGFHLYVPERYRGDAPWPLVVALHGAMGSGADFLWTWLREARSRRFLLLAPTSRDTTWSMHGPDLDGPSLQGMVRFVGERWNVDPGRVLLAGLSDGGTFALLAGLGEGSPFTALACISGVLHPANLSNGNLARARGRRIYVAHGALDWLFPPALARLAAETLREAGADVTHHEIEDLSHTYPREENDAILRWLDPSLVPVAPVAP